MQSISPLRPARALATALLAALSIGLGGPALAATDDSKTYDQESVIKDATEFFGETTEGLAKVIEKAFKEQGRPNGYIKGEEVAGAIGVGLRYGDGTLSLKNGGSTKVYWQGPSLGFDLGANASKVFVLVYKMPKTQDIFKRYPGVDGSLYYVAGAGINYQQRDGVVLAPIRLGVGLRTGASIGYIHYTPTKTLNPL
jgi:hypothetical protein